MRGEKHHFEFVYTPSFEAAAKKLLTEEDRRSLELLLLDDPNVALSSNEPEDFVRCGSAARVAARVEAVVCASSTSSLRSGPESSSF